MNRIDYVIDSYAVIVVFFVFVVYAKVPMQKSYGSVSVPVKVIKILSITSRLTEVSNGWQLG